MSGIIGLKKKRESAMQSSMGVSSGQFETPPDSFDTVVEGSQHDEDEVDMNQLTTERALITEEGEEKVGADEAHVIGTPAPQVNKAGLDTKATKKSVRLQLLDPTVLLKKPALKPKKLQIDNLEIAEVEMVPMHK